VSGGVPATTKRVLDMRFRPGPATIASASFLCLLIDPLFLALQIKTIFSDQLKQEYVETRWPPPSQAQIVADRTAGIFTHSSAIAI